MTPRDDLVIIGAGPAGLTAGYQAVELGLEPIVLEGRDKVGGIASTENHRDFLFDMGGHRFFSTHPMIYDIWNSILKEDFLTRDRLSRIFYKGKFFDYPLRAGNALRNINPLTAFLFLQSYLWWHLFPHREEKSFEHWVTNRFGKRLFETFFKSYTEKVWGIPCSELSAEWAAQRIKNLTLRKTITSMLSPASSKIRSLIDQFHYPRRGPGMMWEAAQEYIERAGGAVRLNCKVRRLKRDGARITAVVAERDGNEEVYPVRRVVSSMPLTSMVLGLDPEPPAEVVAAAQRLHYRAFLTICLIINKPDLFPDQWIYIHDPTVKMGRIQNYKNWSPDMVPDPAMTGLGLEYFCNEGDELWSMPDADLLALAERELIQMGLVQKGEVIDGSVFRVPKAYPVYDSAYNDNLRLIREFVDRFENLQTIGRNGLFRYNNMDHSMLTAICAVDNLSGKAHQNVWRINEEQVYLEEAIEDADGRIPDEDGVPAGDAGKTFCKIDRFASGVALGAVAGVGLFLMTIFLVIKGGEVVGPNLGLLGQYFPGYSVTTAGSFVGLFYGFVSGFLIGWFGAVVRNLVLALLWIAMRFKTRRDLLKRLLDYI